MGPASGDRTSRRLRALARLCCLAVALGGADPAAAQDSPLEEPRPVTFRLGPGGKKATAVLERSDESMADMADLRVFTEAQGRDRSRTLVFSKRSLTFWGSSGGQVPSLAVSKRGSLLVRSGNEGIGRGRWTQVLTVAWRGGRPLVVGVTRSSWDTLGEYPEVNCDLNLLTGQGVRNGQAVKVKPAPIPLADWDDGRLPGPCSDG